MEDGIPLSLIHILQSYFNSRPRINFHLTALYLYPILGTMERDIVGHLSSRDQMEAGTHWHSSIDCKYRVDDSIHPHMETVINRLRMNMAKRRNQDEGCSFLVRRTSVFLNEAENGF